MLSGRRWTAPELARLSLATCVDAAADDAAALRGAVDSFVGEHLLTASSRAVAVMKRLAAHVLVHAHDDNKRAAARAFTDAVASPDMRYGVASFASKTAPDWHMHLKARL